MSDLYSNLMLICHERGGKMTEGTPKRKIKDSVFTNLFQDRKYLLQLYKALHPEDCNVMEDAIADVTIKHDIYGQKKKYSRHNITF